ncbi:unnamed protein product [Clonostachys byssicola]|uniref:FAD-binding PCMH-type domain-containing protein n=1 Tax=Clonostachys byssicola TaxID=160290 RepID=A0A9N9YAW1_9HYPO|nr:unnamed protein product [Clonostachys byssicola]
MTVSQAIEALKQTIADANFVERGTDEFTKLNTSYLSGLESDLEPAWIIQPRSKEDVPSFLKTIKPFVGTVGFAVRGAGQQPLPGSANVQDGITLDLGLLKGIDVKDGVVEIAAGERWGAVYEKLDPHGLAVAGGRSAVGGIGGLSLMGGLSFFSSREGFIVDNIINYEVALASGEIVNANADENADLWTALKGAGNNLGIVTRFDMRTFKQGPIYGGTVFYFSPSFPSQIEALVTELRKPDASKETHLMISQGFSAAINKDTIMCLNQPYYTQAVEDPPELQPFTKVQPQIDQMNSMRLHTVLEGAKEQEASSQTNVRCAYMNITVKADADTLKAASEFYTAGLTEPVKSVENAMYSFTLQPYPLSLLEKSAASGDNVLGLNPSDGPLVSVLLLSYWKNKSDDETVLGMMKDGLAKMKADAESRGQLLPFVYMNYAFSHQDPLASYGEENREKLAQASKKYDPEGVFQKGITGGFKLF